MSTFRNKNRRPDVAVYVPRAGRTQERGEQRIDDGFTSSEKPGGKQRKQRSAAELYVPRAKRLQQEKLSEDGSRTNEIFHPENKETASESVTDASCALETKHRIREKNVPSGDTDLENEAEKKSARKRHKNKSKKTKHYEDHCSELDTSSGQKRKHAGDTEVSAEDPVETPGESDTWEEEMKFYDSVNNEVCVDLEGVDTQSLKDECNSKENSANASEIIPSTENDISEVSVVERGASPSVPEAEKSLCAGADDSVSGDLPNIASTDSPGLGTMHPGHATGDPPDTDRQSETEPSNSSERAMVSNSLCDSVAETSEKTDDHGAADDVLKTDTNPELKAQTETSSDTEKPSSMSTSECEIVQDMESCAEGKETRVSPELERPDGNAAEIVAGKDTPVKNVNSENEQNGEAEMDEDGDTWDSLFADDGEALDPKLMEEVSKSHSFRKRRGKETHVNAV